MTCNSYTLKDETVSTATYQQWIQEIETKLKYTRKTVKRTALEKELLFWKANLEGDKEKIDRFFDRYPTWGNKEVFS